MPVLTLVRDYLVWHYSRAYIDLLRIWWNYLWFVNHLFSVPDVVLSLFAPFKRLQEDKISILKDREAFFANLFVNIMMRIVGFCIRSALIVMAFIGFILVFALGIAMLALWTTLPVLLVHFFRLSISILFL